MWVSGGWLSGGWVGKLGTGLDDVPGRLVKRLAAMTVVPSLPACELQDWMMPLLSKQKFVLTNNSEVLLVSKELEINFETFRP